MISLTRTIFLANLVLTVLFTLIITARAENKSRVYAWTPSDLRDIESLELQFVQNLTKFPTILYKDSNVTVAIETYLQDFYSGSGILGQNVRELQETLAWKNAICGFRLIDRIAHLLKDLVLNPDFNETFDTQTIANHFEQNGWPNDDDVKDAGHAILRIPDTYGITVKKLSEGWIFTEKTSCTLNSGNSFKISKIASKNHHYSQAIEWLELAKEKVLEDKLIDPDAIEEALWFAIEEHNKVFRNSRSPHMQNLFIRQITHAPGNSKTAENHHDTLYRLYKGQQHTLGSHVNYWSLCSGESFQTEKKKSELFCWLEFKIHSSFTIGPMKMEFLNRNPDVVQIYEILNKQEMQWMKDESTPKLERAGVISRDGTEYKSVNVRTSMRAKIYNEHWFGTKLSKRIEGFTGLQVVNFSSSENLQVNAYSFAGQFTPHYDSISTVIQEDNRGDRIATVLFYLDDVELGGETAFPALGIVATPVAGSAALWFNIYSDGNQDDDVFHGACPVLMGEKWIANKWIRFYDQLLVRKCGLDPTTRFEVSVNGVIS